MNLLYLIMDCQYNTVEKKGKSSFSFIVYQCFNSSVKLLGKHRSLGGR